MNVRLQYDVNFLAGVYFDQHYFHNSYSVVLELLTQNTDKAFTNVAMERLKYFTQVEMDNTVFVQDTEVDSILAFQALGLDVTTLPEAPFDQIVGIMLHAKLNAIMEGQMLVTRLDISSHRGDHVWYMHETGESAGPFAEDGWWHVSSPQHCSVYDADVNVVKLDSFTWAERDLHWPCDDNNTNTVVHVDFSRDENKPTR